MVIRDFIFAEKNAYIVYLFFREIADFFFPVEYDHNTAEHFVSGVQYSDEMVPSCLKSPVF